MYQPTSGMSTKVPLSKEVSSPVVAKTSQLPLTDKPLAP